jgi:hypothetical protein
VYPEGDTIERMGVCPLITVVRSHSCPSIAHRGIGEPGLRVSTRRSFALVPQRALLDLRVHTPELDPPLERVVLGVEMAKTSRIWLS